MADKQVFIGFCMKRRSNDQYNTKEFTLQSTQYKQKFIVSILYRQSEIIFESIISSVAFYLVYRKTVAILWLC